MLAESASGAEPATCNRSARSVRSAQFKSRRAEQSIVSELALAWRPHPTPADSANASVAARFSPISARSSLRPSGGPKKEA